MGVFWGLISALGFGGGDFFARGVSMKLSSYRALFLIHFASGLLLAVVVLIDGIPGTVSAESLGLAALIGAINTFASLLFYRALAIGKISVVSPIVSTFGGISLLLALLAGDVIAAGSLVGLVLMLVGVLIVSIIREAPHPETGHAPLRGLPEAVIAAVAMGINFWALQFVVHPLGAYIPTLVGRGVTVILLLILARPMRRSVGVPPREYWFRIFAAAAVTTVGEVAYNIGVQGTTPGIVAMLSSLFSPVTVLLALVFLRERLAGYQWVGVGIIFVATVLVGVFQNFQ